MYDDLFTRMIAAEQPVLGCVNDENQYLPSKFTPAHNLGRWWEAALELEATTGMKIPSRMERAMSLNLRAMTNNPYGLLLTEPEVFGYGDLNYHNLREALLTFSSLIQYRKSRWAPLCAEKLLDTINRRFFEKTLTDDEICAVTGEQISEDTMVVRPADDIYRDVDDTPTTGRAIEGMYRYWLQTNSPLALEVMQKAVAFHREHAICADGSTPAWMTDTYHTGHNHSYLGTVRGLLLYAIHFNDKELIESIYLTYKKSIPKYNCDETGYAPHDLALARFPDQFGDPQGDHASCTDRIYIAYLLALHCGYVELLDDVEKLIRARLFPFQVKEGAACGAWGTFCTYFGIGDTVDVYCLIASTFCHMYRTMLPEKEDGVYVQLHFSGKTSAVTVESFRDNKQHTKITPHTQKCVYVRIPAWCPEESIKLTDEAGNAVPYSRDGIWLVISPEEGKTVELTFDLPTYETTTSTWVSKKQFLLSWKGDALISTKEL